MNTTNLLSEVAKKIVKIRVFEETLLSLFSKGKLFGTTHTYIGQESIAASASMFLDIERDHVFSSHRCHGHFIALSGPEEELLAEIMGKKSKICNGFGGSQHIKYKNFFSNGIQGGTVGNATGIALAKKINSHNFDKNSITAVFLGDGTLGEGLVYESLNFASLNSLKILYVVENNQYAQSTPITHNLAGSIEKRITAFNISHSTLNSNDPNLNLKAFENAINYVRNESKPFVLIVNTYRLGPHSKGDDNRDKKEIEAHKLNDPIVFLRKEFGDKYIDSLTTEYKNNLDEKYLQIDKEPFSTKSNNTLPIINHETLKHFESHIIDDSYEENSFLTNLNLNLEKILNDKESFIIGEDILDPYGGAFKVTKGLSTKFPEKVISTSISELGLVAWSTGASLVKSKPIAEIMFSDFLTLAYDQILNHASKFHWMYNFQVNCPIIVRVASGAGRGYGPTHSQSIEKYFVGVTGITIFAPSLFVNPGKILNGIYQFSKHPTIFVEHKSLYPKKLINIGTTNDLFEVNSVGIFNQSKLFKLQNSNTIILSYGNYATLALEISKALLIESEIETDVFIPINIWPLSNDYFQVLKKYKNIVILEENDEYAGWGSEIISQIAQRFSNKRFLRVGSDNFILPSCGVLESEILPSLEKSINRICNFLEL